MYFKDHYPEFFTATNLNWLPVLGNDHHKQILIEALQNRVKRKQVIIYAFVIMPNHFHIIWRLNNDVKKLDFQRDFMKFTARSILKFMQMNDDPLLQKLAVKAADRNLQVWERNSLSIALFSDKVFMQKLDYMHNNPLQPKWRLVNYPEEYFYSSAKFYHKGSVTNDFGLLTHYMAE